MKSEICQLRRLDSYELQSMEHYAKKEFNKLLKAKIRKADKFEVNQHLVA